MSIIREIKAAWRWLFPSIKVYGQYELDAREDVHTTYVLSEKKDTVTFRYSGSLKEHTTNKREFAFCYRRVS